MKFRKKPKVWMRENIIIEALDGSDKYVGHLQLVEYLHSKSIPHLEYFLEEGHRRLRMMSNLLPRYLKECEKHGVNRMIAVVMADNVASIKLLEKNGFIKFSNVGTDEKISYIRDIMFAPNEVVGIVRELNAKKMK